MDSGSSQEWRFIVIPGWGLKYQGCGRKEFDAVADFRFKNVDISS